MAQYAHLSAPDPEWVQFALNMPSPLDISLPLEELRRGFNQAVLDLRELWDPPYPESGLKISETTIPVDGGSITVRTYVPEAKVDETSFPLLVWYHGGGFMLGDLELDDPLMRLICVNQRISCVNVDYRLAPEYPFPIPVNDCYRATQWAATNADSLSADLTKGFLIGGCSAGANMTAVLTLKARDDPLFKGKLTGQILQVPFVCHSGVYPDKWKAELLSLEQNEAAPLLNKDSIERFLGSRGLIVTGEKEVTGYNIAETYAPPDLSAPEVSPLLASSHANLPAAYLQICGMDPLRDEGLLYAKVLTESGVPTKHDIYPGHPHAFSTFAPKLKWSKRWREDVQIGVQWLLQHK